MGFCGYKYRFGLYAAHSNLNAKDQKIHYHNFTIILYINNTNNQSDDNYQIEKEVQKWLQPFQGKKLPEMELFQERDTTIEGIGDTFFSPLYDLIDSLSYELVKLELFENPIRVYSVSHKLLDHSINKISRLPKEIFSINISDDSERMATNFFEEWEEVAVSSEKEVTDVTLTERTEKESTEIEIVKNETTEIEIVKNETTEIEIVKNETTVKNSASSELIKTKVLLVVKLLIGLSSIFLIAGMTMEIVRSSGLYPQGSDTFCHLYRADLVLEHIKNGNWFPLYDSRWYNGVEIMRYWGPIPLYLIAGLEWIIKSTVLDAYILLLGFLIVLGGCGWLLWGYRYQRVGLSILIGLVWFYMPEHMRVVIYEGNLPRGVIHALLPYFFYFLFRVMEEKRKKSILPLILVTMLITLCHLGITIMLFVSATILVAFYARLNANRTFAYAALGFSLAGILLSGIWVVPALIGGAASGNATNQVMKFFFESITISLNPFLRFRGDVLTFYFGISVFILCLLGIMFGNRKARPGFITALILYFCTTKSVYELFSKLPFSQFLWMIRFIPIGLAAAMASFFVWKQLRKWMILLLCILLIMDSATSLQYIYFSKEERVVDAQAGLDQKAKDLLIQDAKEITKQRLAIMDLSKYGAYAPYYVAGVGKKVNYTFGAGWEGSSTATNIVNLNTALEQGWYVYMFDRALGLGNDTVLIPIDNLKHKSRDIGVAVKAASKIGYELVKTNGNSLLFHKETIDSFGIVSKYENIAIGDSADGISMIFPSFLEGEKSNINEYSYEELSKYKTIYLSGFTYQDKVRTEELLLQLAESGVAIYIDMNSIPVDKVKKRSELFQVEAHPISFRDSFPELKYQQNTYQSMDFSIDAKEWNTYYLSGLEQIDGTGSVPEKNIPYIGRAKHQNLHFIGLNLVYYLQTTKDSQIKQLMETVFDLKEDTIPQRNLVPIQISIHPTRIEIFSEYDNVNTTISRKDIFHSTKEYEIEQNLIVVQPGRTVITMKYPYLYQGLFVTLIGAAVAILFYIKLRFTKEETVDEQET